MASFRRITLITACLFLVACERRMPSDPVTLDGSSTVFPLSEAVAHEFMKTSRYTPVNVTFSGTGTGFQKFCRDQLDVANASRPITEEERKACDERHVEFVELPVAHDAITIIVNARNTWASSITVKELRTLWEPAAEKRITKWSQVRSDWPDRPITLLGPGTESGTFDYFTEVINGRTAASRKDYQASADDEAIVKGVASDEGALAYVGHAYYERHRAVLKAVPVDDLKDDIGRGPIEPTSTNVGRGVYRPLSRPLFIYVNTRHAERPEVTAFVQFYLREAGALAPAAGSMPLMRTAYELAQQRFARKVTGTMYTAKDAADMGVEYLLTQ